jgi:hypothetical protein
MTNVITDDTNYWMTLIGKNIFYLTYLDSAQIDLEIVEEVRDNGLSLHGKQRFFSIIDLRDNFATMSPEGKDLLANDELLNSLRIGEAILVNSLAMKLLTRGYLRFHKPQSPTKVFTNEEDLYKWYSSLGMDEEGLNELRSFFMKKQQRKRA